MQLLSGAGKPASSLGDTADFYVDTTGLVLYKKTDHSTWANTATMGVDAAARVATGQVYTPADATNWLAGVPATTQDALDKLAARVTALLG